MTERGEGDQPNVSAGSDEPDQQEAVQTDVDAALAQAQAEETDFSRGDALTLQEAFDVAAANRTTVVVFAGNVGSGKTTLMASLYERFGRGPVAGRIFAGSRTLPGFERRCHLGRVVSGLTEPDMPHTPFDALPWLHLRTRAVDGRSKTHDLLLGDFYGEHFTRLVAGTVEPSQLPFLRRADHVCLIVDGQKVASHVARLAEIQGARDLLRVLLQDETLASPLTLCIVVTKLDMVRRAGDEAQAEVDGLVTELRATAREAHPSVEVPSVLTAARSTIAALPLGHGLEDLLALWVTQPAIQPSHAPPPIPAEPSSAFDLFRG